MSKNIKGVKTIVTQDTHDYEKILRQLKPDYLVHGDDWRTGIQSKIRTRVINVLQEWGGELVEPRYTKGISSKTIVDELTKNGITADTRRKLLRRLLSLKPLVRILEAHNGLTGLIAEKIYIEKNSSKIEFDGIWER